VTELAESWLRSMRLMTRRADERGYAVDVDNIVKSFGTQKALDGLTLRVKPARSMPPWPNGSGKTTLIRAIVGLVAPDREP